MRRARRTASAGMVVWAAASAGAALFASSHDSRAGETATLALLGVVYETVSVSITAGPLVQTSGLGQFAVDPGASQAGGVLALIDGAGNLAGGFDLLLVRDGPSAEAYELRYDGDAVRFFGDTAILAAGVVAPGAVAASGGPLWLQAKGDPAPSLERLTLVVRAR